jgi:uncharacterized protein (TIGR02265 family)
MIEQKLIFGQSVEVLLTACRGRISTATVKGLAAKGIHFDKKLDPAYPAEAWAEAVRLISTDLFPGVPAEEAHRQLAHRVVQQFTETVTGRVLVTVAKLLGHERSLNRMTHSLRTGANFLDCRVTPEVGGVRTIWMSDVSGVPGFYRGMLEFGGAAVGFERHLLEIIAREGTSVTFKMTKDTSPAA